MSEVENQGNDTVGAAVDWSKAMVDDGFAQAVVVIAIPPERKGRVEPEAIYVRAGEPTPRMRREMIRAAQGFIASMEQLNGKRLRNGRQRVVDEPGAPQESWREKLGRLGKVL